MSYSIINTEGLILYSRSKGEADKLLYIFTREIGYICAIAQGIRLEKSKLRYIAQDYSFGSFSLVRGREYWRLTDAKYKDIHTNTAFKLNNSILIRVVMLLKRLLHGEEVNTELYDCIWRMYQFEATHPNLLEEQLKVLESLEIVQILHLLGYIGDDKEIREFISQEMILESMIDSWKGKRIIINKHINKALKESHL